MRTTQIFNSIILLIGICAFRINAQSINKQQPPDTSKKAVDTFLQNELNKRSFTGETFNSNYIPLPGNPVQLDTSTLWLQTRLQLGEMVSDDPMKSNFKASVLNPLRQQFAGIESMKAIKYILATIQAGAVGYLAYEHIRKYGFLKKK